MEVEREGVGVAEVGEKVVFWEPMDDAVAVEDLEELGLEEEEEERVEPARALR